MTKQYQIIVTDGLSLEGLTLYDVPEDMTLEDVLDMIENTFCGGDDE